MEASPDLWSSACRSRESWYLCFSILVGQRGQRGADRLGVARHPEARVALQCFVQQTFCEGDIARSGAPDEHCGPETPDLGGFQEMGKFFGLAQGGGEVLFGGVPVACGGSCDCRDGLREARDP